MSTNGQAMKVLSWTSDGTVFVLPEGVSKDHAQAFIDTHPDLGIVFHTPSGEWANPVNLSSCGIDSARIFLFVPVRNRDAIDSELKPWVHAITAVLRLASAARCRLIPGLSLREEWL